MSQTTRLAIFGHPVAHSRSPHLHRHFARQFGIRLSYEKIEVPPGMLAAVLPVFCLNGGGGGNVTLPHKEDAFALCSQVSERARRAGSVNTLKRLDQDQGQAQWFGDNTDGAGFIRDLTVNLAFDPGGRRILIVGAGGALRGLMDPLLQREPAQVVIANRTLARAEALVDAADNATLACSSLNDAANYDPFDLVINATSAGLAGGMPDLPDGLFAKRSLAYDLIYGDRSRPFLNWAQSQGAARCADGTGMFLEQGALAFELWFDKKPSTRGLSMLTR